MVVYNSKKIDGVLCQSLYTTRDNLDSMSILARFRAIEDNDKASAVRKLMQASTPNFDFFYITALSVCMATLGLLLDSTSIVIGSMLIAPALYPILATALGFVMSDPEVIGRSSVTLAKSFMLGLGVSVLTTLLFSGLYVGGSVETHEVLSRIDPSLLHFVVALVAGAAVAFALAQPEWSETLPGIAISVALIPPLAVIGVGIADLNLAIISGSTVMLLMNVGGIIFAAMITFSLMNLHDKKDIASSTIRREEEREKHEKAAIAEVDEIMKRRSSNAEQSDLANRSE